MLRFPHLCFFMLLMCCSTAFVQAADLVLPDKFTPLGPDIRVMKLASGKAVAIAELGAADGKPVLFVSGSGTSANALGMTDFLADMRAQLGLRFIAIGRDGFGRTDLTENFTYADYAKEVVEVLDSMKLDKVTIVAISGGGPYASTFAASYPQRVEALHLLAAYSQYNPDVPDSSGLCSLPKEKQVAAAHYYAANPLIWWDLGENPPTQRIPGFSTAAENDGARTFAVNGQKGDGAALEAEFKRFCTEKLISGAMLKAPVYIYEGLEDTTVKAVHGQFWNKHWPNVVRHRQYPKVGHTVQYRHWDQVLLDLAGMADKMIVCKDDHSSLVDEKVVDEAVASGAFKGLCLWQ